MDVVEGIEDSPYKKVAQSQTIVLPEMNADADLDVYALDEDSLDQLVVGSAWSLGKGNFMIRFDKVPCYEARYVLRKKHVWAKDISTEPPEKS